MSLTVTQTLGIALLVGIAIGTGVRWLLGRRTHLSFAAGALSGIVGAFLGTAIVTPFFRHDGGVHPVADLVGAFLGTLAVVALATRFSRPPQRTPEQLLAAGESNDVEFKSTARRNLHTGQRDDKIEFVIAKSVAGLANSDGGTLLIGVADDGTVLGLDHDLPLMKAPDVDRYELWLRDYLTAALGTPIVSALQVRFPTVAGRQLCEVRVPRSARPVFAAPSKGSGPQLWLRVGNSTRQLPLDQALSYAADRFGRRGLRPLG